MNKEKVIVIIPAYEPPPEFIDYAKKVSGIVGRLLIVNDGSGADYDGIFDEAVASENVTYISYGENRGKGYALKQAFGWCAENCDGEFVCVSADCDGQHDVSDIERVAEAAFLDQDALILGARDFDQTNVPKRSRFGNTAIRRIFSMLYGLKLSDTQTGLRGFSVKLAKHFLSVPGDRFEYEMNMLIDSKKSDIPIVEIPIKTIYPEDPKEHVSHFKSIKDSARIIGAVAGNLKWYIISSLLSGILDLLLFFVLSSIVFRELSAVNTLIATVVARVSSSLLNFSLNKKYVFSGKEKRSIIRYYVLWFCQLGASYGLVFLFGNLLRLPLTPVKLIGDLVLAFFSYQIQKLWVFKNGTGKRGFGTFALFLRTLARLFTKGYKTDALPHSEPVVYVCRHLNMHGPFTTLAWLDHRVHPMVLSCFFTKDDCYRQYAEFTFTKRCGKAVKRHNPKAFIASRIVPCLIKSLGAIPVYRGKGENPAKTLREAMKHLKASEDVIVYPDVDYTADYSKESELYEGFLLLGQLYKRNTGKSLRFVPLYIDEKEKMIKEYPYAVIDSFREGRAEVYDYIKSAINGKVASERNDCNG